MDLLNQIRELLPQLTTGERTAAEYVLAYPFDVIRFPAAEIAEGANTSRSNVVRFCQKLGFSGYSEFKYALDRSLKNTKHFPDGREEGSVADTVLQKYLSEFSKLDSLYHSTQLREVAEVVSSSRRVLVLGWDHSFYAAQQLAFRLTRSGIGAMAVNLNSVLEAYHNMLDEQDAILIFSVQGKSYSYLLQQYGERHPKVILITMSKRAPTFGCADQVITLPSVTRSYSRDMLDDAPTFYLFIELLMEAIHALPAPPSAPSEVQGG